MSAFQGFTVIKETLRHELRRELVNLAVIPEKIESAFGNEYLIGRDVVSGRAVRAILTRSPQRRACFTLGARFDASGTQGIIILSSCSKNRNGTWEASGASSYSSPKHVLTDGTMRACAAVQRAGGAWVQSVQHLRTGRATACRSYEAVVDAVIAALGEDGPGRAGAVVRGWHPVRDGAMGFEVGLAFDPSLRGYLDAETSFSMFLAKRDVWVAGIGEHTTGERCLDIVGGLIERHPDDIVWEVISKRTYSLGGMIAESAGLGVGRDASTAYRMGDYTGQTGCLPSIIGFVERYGTLWPRVVSPQRGEGEPVSELRVPTTWARPSTVDPRQAVGGRSDRRSKSVPAETAPACPAPLPPDLILPRLAAAGHGSPDLCASDGIGAQDVAALSASGRDDVMPRPPPGG